jgi:hypothetical protein
MGFLSLPQTGPEREDRPGDWLGPTFVWRAPHRLGR